MRRAYENFNPNPRDLAAAAAAFAPDAECVTYLAALEEEIYRGRDEIERMWREVLRDVPDLQIELVEVVADGADTVVVKVDFLGMAGPAEPPSAPPATRPRPSATARC